jgi:hypothetical protein
MTTTFLAKQSKPRVEGRDRTPHSGVSSPIEVMEEALVQMCIAMGNVHDGPLKSKV